MTHSANESQGSLHSDLYFPNLGSSQGYLKINRFLGLVSPVDVDLAETGLSGALSVLRLVTPLPFIPPGWGLGWVGRDNVLLSQAAC